MSDSKWEDAYEAICARVESLLGEDTDVRFSAFANDADGIPIDNLDEVVVPGLAIFVAPGDKFWGGDKSRDFRSEVLENLTWLDVCSVLQQQIECTRDRQHVFIEDIIAFGKTIRLDGADVPLYGIGLGSYTSSDAPFRLLSAQLWQPPAANFTAAVASTAIDDRNAAR